MLRTCLCSIAELDYCSENKDFSMIPIAHSGQTSLSFGESHTKPTHWNYCEFVVCDLGPGRLSLSSFAKDFG